MYPLNIFHLYFYSNQLKFLQRLNPLHVIRKGIRIVRFHRDYELERCRIASWFAIPFEFSLIKIIIIQNCPINRYGIYNNRRAPVIESSIGNRSNPATIKRSRYNRRSGESTFFFFYFLLLFFIRWTLTSAVIYK